MPLPYVKQTWNNGVAGGTPISAARLQYMEDGLADLDAGKQAVIPPGTYAGSKGGIPTTAVPTTETQGGTLPAPTPTTVFSFQPRDPAKGPFNFVIGGATFGGFFDAVSYFGYNVADGGGRAVATEPRFSFNIEQDYFDGTNHLVEAYFEWNIDNSVTGYAAGTKQWRPIFWQFNRTTGDYSFQLAAKTGIALTDPATDIAWGNIGIGGLSLSGRADQSTDTAIVLSALNGKKTFLQMSAPVGGGFLLQNVTSNSWSMQIGATEALRMTTGALAVGDPSPGFMGVVSARPAVADKDMYYNFYARAQTGQSTQFLVFHNDTASALLYYINVTGEHYSVGGTAALPALSFVGDTNTGVFRQAADVLGLSVGGNEALRVAEPTDGNVALLVRRNVAGVLSLQQVSMGAADSGGAGFKALRVPN